MKKIFNNDEWKRMADNYDKVKYKCKCGHKTVIPEWKEKGLCGWCGSYVFKSKKDEFDYRMREMIK